MFLAKYETSGGAFVEAVSYGGTSNDYIFGMGVVGSGEVVSLAFSISPTLTVGDTTLTSAGAVDSIVCRKVIVACSERVNDGRRLSKDDNDDTLIREA